jgi:hypothetical protein
VNWITQVLLVVFAGIALVTGNVVNKHQSKQLIELETKLEKQREETAVAVRAALNTEKLVKEPRIFDRDRAKAMLDSGPKGSASFLYAAGNQDAEFLAYDLAGFMSSHGWRCTLPQIGNIPEPGVMIQLTRNGWNTKNNDPNANINDEIPEPARSLRNCFLKTIEGNPVVRVGMLPSLSDDEVRILVGPKY